MKLGYSEFSFVYAFTENPISWSPGLPTSAPTFPNLAQEGDLGYDVQWTWPGSRCSYSTRRVRTS